MSSGKHALVIGIDRYPGLIGRDLRGCNHDADLMQSILVERFGFPAEHILSLRDAEGTRDRVLEAFAALVDRVEPGDAVVVYYAGHGSRMRDPLADDPDALIESLVTYDSGRGTVPNRDILDREIDLAVRQLCERSDNVTLIFDCCHSGSVTRDVGVGPTTRQVEPDLRPPEEMFGGAPPPELPRTRSVGLAELPGPSGWLPRRTAVLLAACQADELANEHLADEAGELVPHGALTWFLSRELLRAGPGTTWRSVFEKVAPQVHGSYRRQTPQLEGARDRELFGTRLHLPNPYHVLAEVRGPRAATLAAGAAHGVTVGSRWHVHPHGVERSDAEGAPPVATLEVTSVGAVRAEARIVSGDGPLEAGQRAFVAETGLTALGLRVRIDAPSDAAGPVTRRLAASQLLRLVGPEEPADVLLRLLPPRSASAPEAPCPHLGALDRPTWAGLGADGRLAVHLQPDDPAAPANLLTDLEAVARYRQLITVDNPAPQSALRDRVRLVVERGIGGGPLAPAEPEPSSGMLLFEEGDVAEFVVVNDHDRTVYVTVLEFGSDGAVNVLYPDVDCPPYQSASQPLAPGASLRLGADHYEIPDGLELHLPEGFPWAAEPGERADGGVVTLKVMVTLKPTDFSGLAQGATRSLDDPHPLEELVAALGGGTGTRSFKPKAKRAGADDDWAAITRAIAVRRPTEGRALDPDGANVAAGGIILRAPGLAGELRVELGESARTRSLTGGDDLGLDEVEALTVATVVIEDPREVATRSLEQIPRTELGEPALELEVPPLGEGWAAAVLSEDESGFLRLVFGAEGEDGRWRFEVPRPSVSPGVSATRSVEHGAARKVLRVIGWSAKRALGAVARGGLALWEQRAFPYQLRTFTADDYRLLVGAGRKDLADAPGKREAPRRLGPQDLAALAEGPALAVVHGTLGRGDDTFSELDEATVAAFTAAYEGRVFAFDHPTTGASPDDNVRWLLEQIPVDVTLDVDVLSHSRGGLVGRCMAALGGDRLRVGRLVTVGTPNRGTPLVDPQHLDAYLSVLIHAARARARTGLRAATASALHVARCAVVGMLDRLVGLRSMQLRGDFLAQLAAWERERTAGSILAIAAAAEAPDAGPQTGLESLTAVLTGRVFGEDNDVVVPTAGAFGDNGSPAFPLPPERVLVVREEDRTAELELLHSKYFALPVVREALVRWLDGRRGHAERRGPTVHRA